MAETFITNGATHQSLMGSPEKRVDTTPDGTLWLLVSERGIGKMFSSDDGGATWAYAGSTSDIKMTDPAKQSSVYPSLFIDRDGYAHVSWVRYSYSPQQIVYARGRPVVGGGWSWSYSYVTPGVGGMDVDTDVIGFPHGSGWVAWASYGANGHAKTTRWEISSSHVIKVAAAVAGPPDESRTGDTALEFDHTGDGKTPSATPHVYLVGGSQGALRELAGFKATYSAGKWTFAAANQHVTIEGTGDKTNGDTNLANTVLSMVYDGSNRLCVVWEHQHGLRFAEWDVTGTAITRRDLPTFPGTASTDYTMRGVSIAHDPVTDDLYVAAYDRFDGDVYWSKLDRALGTWSAWALIATRVASDHDGKVQLVRHAPLDVIDLIFATLEPDGTLPFLIYHTQLARLVRKPLPPTLEIPENGRRIDAAKGISFGWEHQKTGPADLQQAWQFRLSDAGVASYWNAASGAFQATEVFNAGEVDEFGVGPGIIANGKSYLWTVRTRATSGQDSDFAPERSFVATTAPVVQVLRPSGLVFAESNPLIEFDYLSPDAMREFEVRVFEDKPGLDPDVDVPVWASGIITSSSGRSARVGVNLLDAKTYVAFARATSVTALTSAWSSKIFSLSLEPPLGPSVGVVPDWSYAAEVPQMILRIQARSNHMSTLQAVGHELWEDDGNANLAITEPISEVTATATRNIERGLILTARLAGEVAARTAPGTPPPAPEGQPQPPGPLDFPVVEGGTYTALFHAMSEVELRAATVVIRWFASDEGEDQNLPANALATTVGDQVVINPTSYTMVASTATAPRGAKRGQAVMQVGGVAAGERVFTSRASFHPGLSQRWQPGGFSDTQTVRIERSDDGGVTWATVEDRAGVDFHQRATEVDRDMPLGQDVAYRAFTDVQGASGSTLSSAVSPIGVGQVEANAWVIRDPSVAGSEINALVIAHRQGDKTAATVHRPLGREFAVVDTENVQSAEGSIDIYVPAALVTPTVALLRRARPMLLQSPAGQRWLVAFLSRDYESEALRSRIITADYVQVG